jgi:hypothetical protein
VKIFIAFFFYYLQSILINKDYQKAFIKENAEKKIKIKRIMYLAKQNVRKTIDCCIFLNFKKNLKGNTKIFCKSCHFIKIRIPT